MTGSLLLAVAALATLASGEYSLRLTSMSPVYVTIFNNTTPIVQNAAVLSGALNSTAKPISVTTEGTIIGQNGTFSAEFISPHVARIQINSSNPFTGALFEDGCNADYFGVWSYPWSNRIDNRNVSFDLKGVGNAEGINWCNARAPFFLSSFSNGYGVYADSLEMGSYDYSIPGSARFIFNSSSLTYYIILPTSPKDFKSILTEYNKLSAPIELPPVSGLGPTFWSDNFNEDFHEGITNAQENFQDVVNHLYDNQIRATSMFADRPYGTGTMSFGNFDFDPEFYPSPEQFIANLSDFGLDFQVWVANRAFEGTELYNTANENGWLFDGKASQGGPALDLTIPEAYSYFKQRLSYFPKLGVRGYKIDRGEEEEMPVYEQNRQMTLFLQLCYETMIEVWGTSKEFFNFARSAVDRSRSRTHVWNGDAIATFTGLSYSVASGIRSGLVGFPVWGSDTGGYVRGDNRPSEELWARWMHFSTFSPVYELMLGTGHTPWYEPYSQDLVGILKSTSNLHHSLIPYIMSYANVAKVTGVPIMRALFLEAPDDPKTYSISDQYFFGEEFLVAPIVKEGGKRTVYFPKGASYVNYPPGDAVYEGGTSVNVSLGLDATPAYVRLGSVLVRGDVYQGNDKWTADWKPSLELELFPTSTIDTSSFSYYNIEQDNEIDIQMIADCSAGHVTLKSGAIGFDAKVTVYTATGTETGDLKDEGGEIRFDDVKCVG